MIFQDPVKVTPIEEIEAHYNYGEHAKFHKEIDYLQRKNVYDNLNTQGMNIEEVATIRVLAEKYKHIFHVEGQQLTFTHCIKHTLNLKKQHPCLRKNVETTN